MTPSHTSVSPHSGWETTHFHTPHTLPASSEWSWRRRWGSLHWGWCREPWGRCCRAGGPGPGPTWTGSPAGLMGSCHADRWERWSSCSRWDWAARGRGEQDQPAAGRLKGGGMAARWRSYRRQRARVRWCIQQNVVSGVHQHLKHLQWRDGRKSQVMWLQQFSFPLFGILQVVETTTTESKRVYWDQNIWRSKTSQTLYISKKNNNKAKIK